MVHSGGQVRAITRRRGTQAASIIGRRDQAPSLWPTTDARQSSALRRWRRWRIGIPDVPDDQPLSILSFKHRDVLALVYSLS